MSAGTPNAYGPTALSKDYFSSAAQQPNQNLGNLASNFLNSAPNNTIGGLAAGIQPTDPALGGYASQIGAQGNDVIGGLAQGVGGLQNNTLGNAASNYLGSGAPVQNWTDPGVAQQWMNPYTNTALQSQLDLMNTQYGQQQGARNQAAIQAGAMGGSREGVQNAIAQNLQNQNMANLVQQGTNQAYNTGQQAFQGQQNLNLQQAGLGGQFQALQNQYGLAIPQLQATLQNMQNAYGLQVPQTAAQVQNLADQYGLSAAQTAGGLQGQQNQYNLSVPQVAGGLYGSQNTYGLGALNALGGAAGTQQNLATQQSLLPTNMLSQYSGLLSSLPGANNTTNTQYQKTNPMSGILGMLGNVAGMAASGFTGGLGAGAGKALFSGLTGGTP